MFCGLHTQVRLECWRWKRSCDLVPKNASRFTILSISQKELQDTGEDLGTVALCLKEGASTACSLESFFLWCEGCRRVLRYRFEWRNSEKTCRLFLNFPHDLSGTSYVHYSYVESCRGDVHCFNLKFIGPLIGRARCILRTNSSSRTVCTNYLGFEWFLNNSNQKTAFP